MDKFKIGDIVARKSYGCDILFKISNLENSGNQEIAMLKGVAYRIQADAPESDLILQSDEGVKAYNSKVNEAINKKLSKVTTYV